jgi:hypothetical protein
MSEVILVELVLKNGIRTFAKQKLRVAKLFFAVF